MHTLVDRGPRAPLSSVYVHIPFCRDRCTYCAFATLADDPALHDRVVEALLLELSRHKPAAAWRTIYLGGGTPGLLPTRCLAQLLAGISQAATSSSTPLEITLEANPANISIEALKAWAALGITRLSIGVQTFNDEALRSLARRHNAEDSRRALSLINQHWQGTWSADLLLGWSGQSREQLEFDLVEIARFKPPHISAYPLEIEPRSLLFKNLQNTDKITSSISHLHISDAFFIGHLKPLGLERYEVSNFAQDGHRSHHNQVYWDNAEYLGLGPGACSSRGALRWTNVRATHGWLRQIEAGRCARAHAERLSAPQRLLESLAVGLRTAQGVSVSELNRRYGPNWINVIEAAAHNPLEELGLQRNAQYLFAPGEQRLRIDTILNHIARNWPEHEVQAF